MLVKGSKVVCPGQPNHLSALHSQLQPGRREKIRGLGAFQLKKEAAAKKSENGENVRLSHARNVRNAVLA